jgi:uncharacterized membrane protein YtjA (UPF0391 family)
VRPISKKRFVVIASTSRPAARAEADLERIERKLMVLYTVASCLMVAIVAAVLGFGGIAVGTAEIAKILFSIFVVMSVVSLLLGLMRRANT